MVLQPSADNLRGTPFECFWHLPLPWKSWVNILNPLAVLHLSVFTFFLKHHLLPHLLVVFVALLLPLYPAAHGGNPNIFWPASHPPIPPQVCKAEPSPCRKPWPWQAECAAQKTKDDKNLQQKWLLDKQNMLWKISCLQRKMQCMYQNNSSFSFIDYSKSPPTEKWLNI